MSTTPLPKYHLIKERLVQAIKTGEIRPGERVPAERQLAKQFKVSHMTARRAVDELVEGNVLERRPRDGAYLRQGTRTQFKATTLNIIVPAYDNSIARELRRYATAAAAGLGWGHRIVRVNEDDTRAAIQALRDGDPALIWLWNPQMEALRQAVLQAADHAVVIGNRYDDYAVTTVVADDISAMVKATEHLVAAGHRKIGIVGNDPAERIAQVQIAGWRSCVEAWCDSPTVASRIVWARAMHSSCIAKAAYEAVKQALATAACDVTALITLNDELALGALAACRDSGRPVPERMSLINSGDSPMMEFNNPPVTTIDVDLERHVTVAMDLLGRIVAGEDPKSMPLRIVQPRLIERKSVAIPFE